jgi:hypothetical protein
VDLINLTQSKACFAYMHYRLYIVKIEARYSNQLVLRKTETLLKVHCVVFTGFCVTGS